ncbi:MAG: hypothetical protein KME59_13865 [Trichormus sp. ATA11-4-KO1]|nr:hypothetical protein [Trichormus sp. ATA11-4-KO1]
MTTIHVACTEYESPSLLSTQTFGEATSTRLSTSQSSSTQHSALSTKKGGQIAHPTKS